MGKLSHELGKQGEDFAAQYLENLGYKILERNFRSSHGEIDIIAKEKDFLVFVEVKNYSFRSFGPPIASIRKAKKDSLIQASKTYLYKNKIKDCFCRFDVLTIYRNQIGEKMVELYKNAFEVREI